MNDIVFRYWPLTNGGWAVGYDGTLVAMWNAEENAEVAVEAINMALRDARRAERERCAQVAERWGGYKSAVIATEIRALED